MNLKLAQFLWSLRRRANRLYRLLPLLGDLRRIADALEYAQFNKYNPDGVRMYQSPPDYPLKPSKPPVPPSVSYSDKSTRLNEELIEFLKKRESVQRSWVEDLYNEPERDLNQNVDRQTDNPGR